MLTFDRQILEVFVLKDSIGKMNNIIRCVRANTIITGRLDTRESRIIILILRDLERIHYGKY